MDGTGWFTLGRRLLRNVDDVTNLSAWSDKFDRQQQSRDCHTTFRVAQRDRVGGSLLCGHHGHPSSSIDHVPVYITPLSTSWKYMGAYVLDITRVWSGIWVREDDVPDIAADAAAADSSSNSSRRGGGSGSLQVHWFQWKNAPRHCVVDTGTAESYFSGADAAESAIEDGKVRFADMKSLQTVRSVNRQPWVRIDFRGGMQLVVGPQRYFVRDRSSNGFRSTFHRHNKQVQRVFGTKPVLLLGIWHLQGLAMDFDIERQHIAWRMSSSGLQGT